MNKKRIPIGASIYQVDFTGLAYRAVEAKSSEEALEMIRLAWAQKDQNHLTSILLEYVSAPDENEFFRHIKQNQQRDQPHELQR